jgi:F-type H+-transporting ATPase subunit gamma
MATVKDLRDRIRSMKNTQQITKAMKQVAAAKIRRAEAVQRQARPYADALGQVLRDLMGAVSSVDHPFMKPGKSGAPPGLILMTADKGLAGAFNSNLIRAAELYLRQAPSARLYTVGNKARNAARRMGRGAADAWSLSAQSKLETAREVARRVTDDFVKGEIGEIVLVSSKLITMMQQRPETRKLVPLERDAMLIVDEKPPAPDEKKPQGAVEFSPSPELVLSRLLPKYLDFTIFSAMLETDAAFFAAQLLAMNNATENAGKLIDEYTVEMNNARQAAITKELLEIVAGAEALAG